MNVDAASVIMRYLVAMFPRLFSASSKDTLLAWASVLDEEMSTADAEDIIRQVIAESDGVPTAGAVNARWRALKARRFADVSFREPFPPMEVAGDPEAYKAWLVTFRRQIAIGAGATLAGALANKQARRVLTLGSGGKSPQNRQRITQGGI